MNLAEKLVDAETRLKKANIKLIRHSETCLYGGVILMGETSIVDDAADCPTAYTDGYNKRYGRKFLDTLSDTEIAGVVLHENLHVLLKHIARHRDLMKTDKRLTNIAMDYVVNDIIMQISEKHPTLVTLPENCFHDPMFRDWSVRRVYEYLKEEQEQEQQEQNDEQEQGEGEDQGDGQGGGQSNKRGGNRPDSAFDDHDDAGVQEMDEDALGKLGNKIDEAIHQGGILAGKFGAKIPRVIKDLMEPEIDWREVLQDFWTAHVRGCDEFTWRRFNKNRLADDYYLPSTVSETIGEVIIAIDTSGSISNEDVAKVASRIQELCDTLPPDRIRVLWWDTQVHGEQLFEGNYSNLSSMLKPQGGGGTRVSCVSEYIINNKLDADCMIIFTDGYVEWDITWQTQIPAVWIIKENGNGNFTPPRGVKAVMKA